MLTFVQSVVRAVHKACRVRTPARWLGLIALIAAFTGLAAQAEPRWAASLELYAAQLKGSIPNYSQKFQPNHQTLEGSFSAVSTPIFASKYSFCSVFRDLQDCHTFAPLEAQNLRKFLSNFFIFLLKFQQKSQFFFAISVEFCTNFNQNFSEFRQMIQKMLTNPQISEFPMKSDKIF